MTPGKKPWSDKVKHPTNVKEGLRDARIQSFTGARAEGG